MSRPVVLILGAGSNIGAGVERHFAGAGYSVALVSRSGPSTPSLDPATGHLRIRADLASPPDVRDAFAATRAQFGKAPRVVVYNAATISAPPDPENLFSLPLEQFESDFKVNTTGAWVAAGEAVAGWKEADAEERDKARFIFTGNFLNEHPAPVPLFVTLGVAKSAAWYWVSVADQIFKAAKGWRFFYADERKPDGSSIGTDRGAESHGKFYLRLAEGETDDLPSAVTFVDGEYQKF